MVGSVQYMGEMRYHIYLLWKDRGDSGERKAAREWVRAGGGGERVRGGVWDEGGVGG